MNTAVKLSWRKVLLWVGLILLVLVGLYGLGWAYVKSQYPYGRSHCCELQLAMGLDNYAREHGGAYPAGEATPEASLSLLYPKYSDANLLRGKSVPLEVVQAILERGERLGPDTCGWHYVEGLRSSDKGLAIAWNKAGLGHNGQRIPSFGREVLFIDTGGIVTRDSIPESGWAEFLKQQETLLAARK